MEGRWVLVCLLWILVSGSCSGETVSCMDTRTACESTGFSSISIIGNQYRCCAPGFSMSVVNGLCSCTRIGQAMQCSRGPLACRNAASMTSDGAGNTLCCPPGYSMSAHHTSINGMQTSSCSCVSGGWGGSMQIISNNGMMSFSNNNNTSGISFNSTAMAERFRNWQQQFHRTMDSGMRTLRTNMQALGRRMQLMGSRMANTFGNMFRGW